MKKYINLNTLIAVVILLALITYVIFRTTGIGAYIERLILYITILGTLPTLYNIALSTYRKQFGVDLIALVAIISTVVIGEHIAGGIILLMLSGGESLEKYAEGKAKSALENLLRFAPTKAHRVKSQLGKKADMETAEIAENSEFEDITVQEINVGDTLMIKRGEVTPVDGVVVSGISSIDESMITGEPMPRDVKMGSKIWSGSINTIDIIYIKTTTNHEQSTFSSIIRLVEKAQEKKAPTVRIANKFSLIFTAITFVIASIAWFIDPKLVVAVLVVATPCPLILAAPIAFIAGMSRSAKKGIIVKHGGVFENITKAHSFFFDKTGTLTFGTPKVKEIIILNNTAGGLNNLSEDKILALSASIEQFSTHILSESIVSFANDKKLDLFIPEKFEEVLGKGINGLIKMGDREIKVTDGSGSYLQSTGINIGPEARSIENQAKNRGEMVVYIGIENTAVALIIFEDKIRDDIASILTKIKETGAEIVLVTGDTEERANKIGKELGFSSVVANCLPENKMNLVQKYEQEGKKVIMIGDGVNDAPAIGRATVGVALGYHGSTTSTDTADAIITSDNTAKILELTNISQKTMRIAFESIFIGMGLSIIAMIFALLGYIKPISGALLQEVIDVLVILNALRALRD
jgi:heavy metal translocating P-type ATPase